MYNIIFNLLFKSNVHLSCIKEVLPTFCLLSQILFTFQLTLLFGIHKLNISTV